jgi:hypothetical protein
MTPRAKRTEELGIGVTEEAWFDMVVVVEEDEILALA